MRSLRARVLVWVSVALVTLFAVTIAGLDRAFQRSTERALTELLEVQLLGLVALAEPDPESGLTLPDEAINPRFDVADSGLYGALWDSEGRRVWQSWSLLDRELEFGELPATGERRQARLDPAGFVPLQALLTGITWEFADGRLATYTIGVGVSLAPYLEQASRFRINLVGWFAGMTMVMLLVLAFLLYWVLRPVRRLERQVRQVEAGDRTHLTGVYPSELSGLAGDLNVLIESERRRLSRHRNTLDDLAHSLKTPLAVMRSLLSERTGVADHTEAMGEELDRMDQRVAYQLQRARATGATGIGTEPVAVRAAAEDLKASLDKVYHDKGVVCRLEVSDVAIFHGDRGDLTELMGNLLDNAYKYCRSQVQLKAFMEGIRLILSVEDDGPGISPSHVEELTRRGRRADETVPGHGIGLAVVRETAALYQGVLEFHPSALGGLQARVELGRAGRSR